MNALPARTLKPSLLTLLLPLLLNSFAGSLLQCSHLWGKAGLDSSSAAAPVPRRQLAQETAKRSLGSGNVSGMPFTRMTKCWAQPSSRPQSCMYSPSAISALNLQHTFMSKSIWKLKWVYAQQPQLLPELSIPSLSTPRKLQGQPGKPLLPIRVGSPKADGPIMARLSSFTHDYATQGFLCISELRAQFWDEQ